MTAGMAIFTVYVSMCRSGWLQNQVMNMAGRISGEDKTFLKSISLLYVEDEETVRGELSEFLRRIIGTLHTAADGRTGLEMYSRERPEVVVTDILMPHMDGLTMAQEMRNRDPDVPIIITTAFNDESYFIKSIEVGVDHYVQKPILPNLLVEAILKAGRLLREKRRAAAANRFSRFVLDTYPNFLLVTNRTGVEYINRPFLKFLGYPTLEAFMENGPPLTSVIVDLPEGDWVGHLLDLRERVPIVHLRSGGADGPGKTLAHALTVSTILDLGKYIFSFANIVQIENRIKNLEEMAFTDPLTGACNRAKLGGFLDAEISRAKRHGISLSIILLDLDHFKKINDTHGHQVGDDVLTALSVLIANHIRASDLVARWGGEEFMLVLPEVDLPGAVQVAEKLRLLIEKTPFPEAGHITSSFGVAQFLADDSSRSLTERADLALYAAKNKGRNRVVSR